MNALQLQNAVSKFAKENSLSFKEALSNVKDVDKSLKLVKVRSSLVKSITLTVVDSFLPVTCTVKDLLSILKGLDPTLEEKNGLVADSTLKILTINFIDGSCRTYSARSTSTSRSPSEEVCANINFLVKSKFNTAW